MLYPVLQFVTNMVLKRRYQNALAKYTGAHRRFEYIGSFNKGVSVYDDYGHHQLKLMQHQKL